MHNKETFFNDNFSENFLKKYRKQKLNKISEQHILDELRDYHGKQYDKSVYQFDGNNTYIDTNQIAVSLVGEVSVFAKVQNSGCLISNRTSGSNYFEVDLGSVGSSLVEVHLKESPNNYTLNSQFINDGKWHHISVEYTGTELSIYVDYVLDSTISGLTNITSNSNNVLIGTNNNNGHVLEGYLSDFEWKDDQGNILIHYKMEERQGTIAYDASGLENHGTLYNILHTEVREPVLYNYTNEEGYNIDNGTIIPKVEGMVKVEDYPWNWITQNKYLLYKGNYFRPSNDGTILQGDQSDYDAVTIINLNSQSLTTNFTNTLLKKFSNLQELKVNNNSIQVLDPSELYELIVLDCHNNSIEVLDVSQLTELTTLYCYINQIGVLNTTNLVKLVNLVCYTNQIQVLDTSQLVDLLVIDCQYNQIQVLDISNSLDLNFLRCNNNQIQVLDVSQLTKLNYIDCNSNQIQSLDTSLLNLLTTFYCHNNLLTSLDISQNVNLVNLICYANQLDNLVNSQILIDLDTNGLSNGYLNSSIFGGGSLPHEGVSSGLNLLDKNWTVVGLPLNYLLNDYSGAAAAYSLYRLNTAYTGPAITVRRDSDNSVQDIGFVNGILDTAALTTFCSTPVTTYTSDFSTSEDLNETNGIGSAGNTIAGVSDVYKFTLTNGNGFHIASKLNYFTPNVNTTITFDYYIPSANTTINSIRLAFLSTTFFNVTDSWETVSLTGVPLGDDLQIFAANDTNFTVNADGDVFYLKNMVVTQTSAANGYVTKWYDQSGNGYDATQTTASSQPKIFDGINGIIEVNGKPAIYTDGINDQLESGILSLSNPTTQFFVFKTLVNAVNEYVGGLYNGQNTASSLLGTFSGDNLFLAQQGPAFPPPTPHNQSQILITAKSSTIGTDWQLFKNGGAITNSGENIGTATGNKIVLGNRNDLSLFGENYFQEYILYNSDETSNRTGIEDNINNRYFIYLKPLTTYNVEDYPLIWINGLYYNTFKDDTFEVSAVTNNTTQAQYDAVTVIDLRNQSLTTGFTDTLLNKFDNLTYLNCINNQITTFAVSQLVNLEYLYCSNNQIATLDVSQLVSLIKFYCDNNQIATLDVSQLTSLTDLRPFNNQISILDVSQLTSLTILYCYGNQISVLDVPQLVNLIDLNCHNNQISVLDVSQLVNLQYLYCNNNQITTLDISQLVNLISLRCFNNQISVLDVSQLTSLTTINCTYNQISILDVSQLVNLDRLYCSYNQISVLNVSQLVNLIELSCTNNQISTLDVSQLVNLNNLQCQSNQLDAATNSQILIDLDTNGLSNGYFISTIFGGGSLTAAGQTAKANLQAKGWNIVGI